MSTYLKEKNIELKVDIDKDTVKIIVEGEESKYHLSLKSQSLKQNLIRNLMIILDTNDRDFVKGIVDKEYRWLIRHKEEANLMISENITPSPQEIYNINNMESLTKSLKKSFKNEFKILKELIINNNQDPPSKNNNDTELITDLREEIYYLDKELRNRISSEEKGVKMYYLKFAEETQQKEEMMKGYCHRIDEFQKVIEDLKKENENLSKEVDNWKEDYKEINKENEDLREELKPASLSPEEESKALKELRENLEKKHQENENLKEENEDLREELKQASLSPEEESKALKELRENLEKIHQEEITAIEKKNKNHLKAVVKRNREDENELQEQIDKLEETIQSITQN